MSSPGSRLEAKGFFGSLFDFGFTSFITLKFLKLIYTVLVVLILIGGVVFLIAGLTQGGGSAVASIILVPIVTLVYLIFARIYMEIIALFFRIGENTSLMAAALTGQPGPGSAPAYGYPAGPGGPPAPPYGPADPGVPPPSYGYGPGTSGGAEPTTPYGYQPPNPGS